MAAPLCSGWASGVLDMGHVTQPAEHSGLGWVITTRGTTGVVAQSQIAGEKPEQCALEDQRCQRGAVKAE